MNDVRPILFNTDMVRAILDGRKTVTRRVVSHKYLRGLENLTAEKIERACKAPYKCGDVLYVRETWYKDAGRYMYRADYSESEKFYVDGKEIKMRWCPSLHMPKDAARIFLRVTGVRVERLRSISAYDVRKEGIGPQGTAKGCKFCGPGFPHYPDCDYAHCDNYKGLITQNYTLSFIALWELTTKSKDRDHYGWAANPWVWVIEFERCERPEVEHGEEKAAY